MTATGNTMSSMVYRMGAESGLFESPLLDDRRESGSC